MSFIHKYESFTLTPFVKPHNILNLAEQNIFYVQLYMESAFTYNPGSTVSSTFQITTYFLVWSNPIHLNWRLAA